MTYEGSRMSIYAEVLQYLDNLELFGIKLGLENITELCRILGNPQLQYKTIHVAGTNGKGSVVAMCSSLNEKSCLLASETMDKNKRLIYQ
jgi:folylpolyglutamate synthase/dihydropteroate synthase